MWYEQWCSAAIEAGNVYLKKDMQLLVGIDECFYLFENFTKNSNKRASNGYHNIIKGRAFRLQKWR